VAKRDSVTVSLNNKSGSASFLIYLSIMLRRGNGRADEGVLALRGLRGFLSAARTMFSFLILSYLYGRLPALSLVFVATRICQHIDAPR